MRPKKWLLQGNTLLDALLAILIFAGALFAIIQFQTSLMRDRGTVNQEAVALTLAEDKMQYFRSYTVLIVTPGSLAYDDIVSGNSSSPVGNTVYNLIWTVTDATDPDRKNVQVQVSWTDSAGASHTVSIASIIARIDPKLTGKVSKNL